MINLNKLAIVFIILLSVATSCKKKKEAIAPVANNTLSEPTAEKKKSDPINFQELGEPLMVYERTVCFGKCPVFIFTIYTNGFATYEGKLNVEKIGFYKTQLAPAKVDELKKSIFENKYFELEEIYNTPKVTDVPSIYTTVTIEHKKKKVVAKTGYPDSLKKMYQIMDQFIKYTEMVQMEKPQDLKKEIK